MAQDQTEKPTGTLGDTNLEWQALGKLAPYLWPADQLWIRARVALAVVMMITAKVATVYIPIFYKEVIDALTPVTGPGVANNAIAAVITLPVWLILGYGLVRVLSLAFAELRDAVFASVAQRAIRIIGLEVFRHLHSLSLRFHLERRTGGMSRAIERGTRAIDTLLRFMLFNILPTLLEVGMVVVVLTWLYGPTMALITFSTIALYVIYTVMVTAWRLKFRRAMNDTDSKSNTRAIDSLLNYETVKYFGNEEHEARRFDEGLKAYERAAVLSLSSLSLLNIGQGLIISGGLTLVMLLAGQGIVDGTMTIGDFVLINTFLIQLAQPLGFFGFVYREIKQSLADIEDMFKLLSVNREIQDSAHAQPWQNQGGSIRFEAVDFGYDPRRQILKGVDFEVPAGRTLAIVGPTGAGKSTISRILFRFYDVDGGRVLIDGQDIRDVTQNSLRSALGIVPQDTVLFNDTIRYNIGYGRPEATDADIEHAAKLAQIHDFILAMPDGYDTVVGERGLKLSGGEKQRVAIARTVLKDPPIILFDEATSALDTATEKLIQAELKEVSKGRTTLIIAHRLSTVIDADEIIVLDAGRIAERGSHQQLLALEGAYHRLWQKQLQQNQL